MKLINKKNRNDDVQKIIKILGIKNHPYEIKEEVVGLVGAFLPITAFCVGGAMLEASEAFALTAYSFLLAFAMILIGSNSAMKKERTKVACAKMTYSEVPKTIVNFLTDEEKQKLLANADLFESDKQTVLEMANVVKIANARRNARHISKAQYKNIIDFSQNR